MSGDTIAFAKMLPVRFNQDIRNLIRPPHRSVKPFIYHQHTSNMNYTFSIFLTLFFSSTFPLSASTIHFEGNKDTTNYRKIHESLFTIDTHTDTPMSFAHDTFDMGVEHNPYLTGSKVDLIRMKKGGLDAVFLAAFIGQGKRDAEGNAAARKEVIHIIQAIDSMLVIQSALAELALTPDQALSIAGKGKSAILIGVENGYPIGNDLSMVDTLYRMGARYITLCHTRNNDICDSSNDTAFFNGLSSFGEQVVKRMNKLGMIIDVSHISDSSFFDVLRLSHVPVMASHSSSRAICDNPRNLTDPMLVALARNGGVAQVCLLSDYVKKGEPNPAKDSAKAALKMKYGEYAKLSAEKQKEYRQEYHALDNVYPSPLATVSDLCDHIDHMVKVAGIDHVGIGSDFDGGGGLADCYDVSQFPNITRELLKRGYSISDLKKIWGGNFLRVFKEVQAGATANINP